MPLFQIMTFDGGGIRGSLVAALLARLRERYPDLLNNVDLFAGTSTGSAIALSLAFGRTESDMQELYSMENMKFVFGKPRWNFLRPRHSNENLRTLLECNFPDVADANGSRKLQLSDLKKKVLVTSFKLDDKNLKSWSPTFFHNYDGEESCMEPSSNEPVTDVALRSAAAPTLFPSHQGFIDGGMMANNPSTAAIAVALRHNPMLRLSDIRLLSLGTGYNPTLIKSGTHNWGILQWLLNPFNLPKEPLLTILFDGVVEADHYMSREILGDGQYCRLNLALPAQTACDDWRAVPDLVNLANSKLLDKVKNKETDEIIDSTVKWLEQNWRDEPQQVSAAAGVN